MDARREGVFIDLADCEHISPVVCLMLCAEIERCQGLRYNSVNGCDPRSEEPRQMLRGMGFHRRLGIGRGKAPSVPSIVEIRSGGQDADIPEKLDDVARIAERVLGDPSLANRVHGALNEAMLNVSMHAYDREFLTPGKALEGRWWVAGFANDNELIFMAYDHGVGIATTAPKTIGEELYRRLDQALAMIGLGRADALDHHIIEAAIKARRSRTGKAQHGKGLTSMIDLIQRAGRGSVSICSHGGQYLYSKPADPAMEPTEGSLPLAHSVPGTLIIWHIASIKNGKDNAGHAHAA